MITPPLLGALLLSLAGLPCAQAQQFVVSPASGQVLAGEPLAIRITGLPADAEVSLHARRTVAEWTGGTRPYGASARFRSDARGQLDLATAVPLEGSSYRGADVRGLFWSMTPEARPENAPGTNATAAATGSVNLSEVELEARQAGAVLARQTVRLLRALPQVQQRGAAPFAGAEFAHLPGPGRRPALILLGGSEGGSAITRDAPVFASRGYAVLALPYYSPPGWGATGPTPAELPGLPAAFADIPLERLEQAREWLAQQPEVDASRIGVVGTSKGAEFALLAATRMPWIKAVVALVPSDVVWEGWGQGVAAGQRSSFAWKGQPLPFVPYKDFDKELAGFATGAEVRIRRPQDAGRAAHPDRVAPARIPVETITAPVLVAGGHDDQIWDSGGMAQNIADSRSKAGRTTVTLVYPDAGHFLGGTGWAPTTQYNAGPSKSGGTPAANAQAQAEVFVRMFQFLAQALGPLPGP
jgi:dienelactone hydrolase